MSTYVHNPSGVHTVHAQMPTSCTKAFSKQILCTYTKMISVVL